MWRFYLLSCAGGFRAGGPQLWQFVFSKGPLREIYRSVR
jgi:cyclopropane-fatty-acyl-phospholipid synthase